MDANKAWTADNFGESLAACEAAGVALIEHPFPAGQDRALAGIESKIRFCADESFHDRESFEAIRGRYQAVNIKLDKTGGLTEVPTVAGEASARGLTIMVGCMLGTSLPAGPV